MATASRLSRTTACTSSSAAGLPAYPAIAPGARAGAATRMMAPAVSGPDGAAVVVTTMTGVISTVVVGSSSVLEDSPIATAPTSQPGTWGCPGRASTSRPARETPPTGRPMPETRACRSPPTPRWGISRGGDPRRRVVTATWRSSRPFRRGTRSRSPSTTVWAGATTAYARTCGPTPICTSPHRRHIIRRRPPNRNRRPTSPKRRAAPRIGSDPARSSAHAARIGSDPARNDSDPTRNAPGSQDLGRDGGRGRAYLDQLHQRRWDPGSQHL